MKKLGVFLLILPIVFVDAINVTDLDCRMRSLALDFARSIQPWRSPEIFQLVHDALRLTELCHIKKVALDSKSDTTEIPEYNMTLPSFCQEQRCIFVNPNATTSLQTGALDQPVKTVEDALFLSRKHKRRSHIVLRRGVHTLRKTIRLTKRDSGLSIRGFPGEEVWMSGGLPLHKHKVNWTPTMHNGIQIQVADLRHMLLHMELPKVAALFTTHSRLIRARYPNSNPETAQWGYASPNKYNYSLPVKDLVLEWHRPPQGEVPAFDYKDFSTNHPHLPLKNDSTMPGYNMYASGHGGVCSDLWGPTADSYWCSNASAGGWSEVDKECAVTGQMQIPVSMSYNTSHPVGKRMDAWVGDGVGGYIYAWHSQSWSMHMFEIASTRPGQLRFEAGGGRQGGRNWCRCDQCTYAGSFCGQHQDPPDSTDHRLISGTWLVENVLQELDDPGEFYFDPDSKLLFLYPNTTDGAPPHDLRFAVLETLIDMHGAKNIAIHNLRFRDAAPSFFGEWSAPSGGDWALHRGGAIFLEHVKNVSITDCIFRRLDGNAVFLSRATRNVVIRRSIFEWIGENAIATWGDTHKFDAVQQKFPMGTLVEENFMRELGIFQKQSSAWGQAKAALSTIRHNIMFNLPRAAINFNDMMGGGDKVLGNLLFNTCRESGDHGPINSWDRQAYLTTLRDGVTPSFDPLMRTIARNFIFANYGASEGVDNDDGSSWFHVKHNVFYDSEGFKMDYGGHDSIYEDNIVISYPNTYGQNCIGFGSFYPGRGHVVRRNKCVVPRDDKPLASLTCDAATETIGNNSYFSPNGTATIQCRYQDKQFSLEDLQKQFGLELGSTIQPTPGVHDLMSWSKNTLWSKPIIRVTETRTSEQ